MKTIQTFGFGYNPEEVKHHFIVIIPTKKDEQVAVYERFAWDDGDIQETDIVYQNAKVFIDHHKWDLVETAIQNEFNNTLKRKKIKTGKFIKGNNPVERLLGKEMVLLLWAIEDSDPSLISTAIKNWLGFSREERWWLFTMTNATTGHADDKRGWRKAIRYAITENPNDDREANQLSFFDL